MKSSTQGRRFRFGTTEYDETQGELSVAGNRCDLEAKPLAVLLALLCQPRQIVSKQQLIDAAWPGRTRTSLSSLATAISKLRGALGDTDHLLIEAVHASGYRLNATVDVSAARAAPRFAFTLAAGEHTPLRPGWELLRRLSEDADNVVWLARCVTTRTERVFKFADGRQGLARLKREWRVSRELDSRLGEREDLQQIIGWNFDALPYYLESAHGGVTMLDWLTADDMIFNLNADQRVAILAGLARTLAAAHAAGVVHGHLSPTRVLVQQHTATPCTLRVIGFRGGQPMLGSSMAHDQPPETIDRDRDIGELPYAAPEVLAGTSPTPAADLYALGVMLYQLVIGDMRRSLTVGWEADVSDALLQQDIAEAVAGDPGRRLASAAMLAQRLATLADRRAAHGRALTEQVRIQDLQRRAERERLRRPWMIGAMASLSLGLIVSMIFAHGASHSRDAANRRALELQSINVFLTQDLLGRGDPAQSGNANETLMDAALAAEARVDQRLGSNAEVAGDVYLALAKLYESRSAYDAARRTFRRAEACFTTLGAAGRPALTITRLLHAAMEISSGQPNALIVAKSIIANVGPDVAKLTARRAEAEVELATDAGMIQMWGGDVGAAHDSFRDAADGAEKMPEIYDAVKRLSLRRQEAFTFARLGNWRVAEHELSRILAGESGLDGQSNPEALHVELNLAEVRLAGGAAESTLADADRLLPVIAALLGPAHFLTLQALALRAEALGGLQRYGDAAAAWLELSRRSAAALGVTSTEALEPQSAAAKQMCRAGLVDEGLSIGTKALSAARTVYGEASPVTQEMFGHVAFCLIRSGRAPQAVPMLDKIDAKSVAGLTMDPNYGTVLGIMKIAIARQNGNYQFGSDLLRHAAQIFAAPGADAYMQQWVRELSFQPGR